MRLVFGHTAWQRLGEVSNGILVVVLRSTLNVQNEQLNRHEFTWKKGLFFMRKAMNLYTQGYLITIKLLKSDLR